MDLLRQRPCEDRRIIYQEQYYDYVAIYEVAKFEWRRTHGLRSPQTGVIIQYFVMRGATIAIANVRMLVVHLPSRHVLLCSGCRTGRVIAPCAPSRLFLATELFQRISRVHRSTLAIQSKIDCCWNAWLGRQRQIPRILAENRSRAPSRPVILLQLLQVALSMPQPPSGWLGRL